MMGWITRSYMILALVLLVLALPVAAEPRSEDEWANYSGHNMSFQYPAEWKITENPTGVTIGEDRIFAIGITMNREICYPLSQHQQLLNLLFMMHAKAVDGTPDGDPKIQASENDIGPHSIAVQTYKNPTQSLTFEIQGYPKKDATVIFAETRWKPQDPVVAEIMPKMDRFMKSFVVTLPDKANASSVHD